MKLFEWNEEKNRKLKEERGVGFEDVITAINDDRLLKQFKHPNQKQYPNQKVYVIEIHDYAYVVPFIEDKNKIFLKTIYPSRVFTKKFIEKGEL